MIIHPTMPERTAEQQLAALEQANRVRSARALLKRTIRQDPLDARRVILNPTSDYRTMLLWDVLDALPLVGPSKVQRFFAMEGISPRRTLAGLTDRQRDAALVFVAEYLQRRAAA